jgi:hypothetical protein
MRDVFFRTLRGVGRKSVLWIKIAVLVFSCVAPALMTEKSFAGQMTPRRVTIGSSRSNIETTYKFDFQMPTATAVQSMIFEFCTAPLGTCTKPNAMDVFTDTTVDAQDFDQATALTIQGSSTNDCNIAGSTADTKVCVTRSNATSESATPDEKSITFGDILNPTLTGVYLTVYVRISVYSTTNFTGGIVHNGVVAAGITQQLTAVGRVAERLKFCVAAIDDTASLPADCDTSFPTTTTIDLGVIDNVSVIASPVDPSLANANLANDRYGILMLNTNASGGTLVTYYPEIATSVNGGDTDQLRAFRVVPTDCSATASSTTDQCFVSADPSTGSAIVVGAEEFGMTVSCFNTTQGSTDNLDPTNGSTWNAAYDGDGNDEDVGDDCENETVDGSYIWGFDTSGTPDDIISTTSATNKVIDDEIIKLRFGAAASATTPTGTYTVIVTYIATPTF